MGMTHIVRTAPRRPTSIAMMAVTCCCFSMLQFTAIAAPASGRVESVYNGDPSSPDISGVWTLDRDLLERPDYRRWLVDGKPIAPGANLGESDPNAALPYTSPYMVVWKNRVAMLQAGTPVPTDLAYCWPPSGINAHLAGVEWIESPKGSFASDDFEVTQTPGRVLLVFTNESVVQRIYTDGREHPKIDEDQRTLQGHTVGRWEGNTLVTDTIGFRKEGELGYGLPHSDALRVVTRYSLKPDGHLDVTFRITDSKALTKPVELKMSYHKRPYGTDLIEYFCAENNRAMPDWEGRQQVLGPARRPGWDLPKD